MAHHCIGAASPHGKAGVPRIRVHDLRHTHIPTRRSSSTFLFNDGQNVKMISQRLGHSDVSITLSVYAHPAPDAQDIAAASINGLIFRAERDAS
jgi:integrase